MTQNRWIESSGSGSTWNILHKLKNNSIKRKRNYSQSEWAKTTRWMGDGLCMHKSISLSKRLHAYRASQSNMPLLRIKLMALCDGEREKKYLKRIKQKRKNNAQRVKRKRRIIIIWNWILWNGSAEYATAECGAFRFVGIIEKCIVSQANNVLRLPLLLLLLSLQHQAANAKWGRPTQEPISFITYSSYLDLHTLFVSPHASLSRPKFVASMYASIVWPFVCVIWCSYDAIHAQSHIHTIYNLQFTMRYEIEASRNSNLCNLSVITTVRTHNADYTHRTNIQQQ